MQEKTVKAVKLSKEIYRDDFAAHQQANRAIYHLQNVCFGTAILEIQGMIVLCFTFRGSDDWQDWKQNFDCELEGGVHRGFKHQVNICMPRILEILEAETFDEIVCSGHSSGGAMAAICMQEILNTQFTDRVCGFGFGMPRCFSDTAAAAFNEHYKAQFFRFHHNNDPVSNVPLQAQGFSHVGTYLHITCTGQIVQEISAWFEWLDRLVGAIQEWWTDD